ncbi:MAG: hypothetical protein WDA74_07580 [Spirochaetota bacterium]
MFKKHTLYIKIFFTVLVVIAFLTTGCMPPENEFDTPEFTGLRSAATEGYYLDRVGVSWSKVEGAATYTILRGTSKDGPFEEIDVIDSNDPQWHIENAKESVTFQPPPILVVRSDDEIDLSDPRYFNISYNSEVDLTKGKFISAQQVPRFRIIMGSGLESDAELNFVVSFPGGTWGKTYNINDIMSAINGQANGKNICEVDSTGKYLKFSSEWGPIAFINEEREWWNLVYSPIKYFIKNSVGNDQMLIVNKDGTKSLNKKDFTGNMADYLGKPIPSDPDADPVYITPDPVVIMRNFSEGDSYYYDDMDIEFGVHYFYRVVAQRENGSFLSMSPCMEGYYVSATAPSEPKNVTVSQGDFTDKVEVYWDSVDGDDITYNVYRALIYPGTFDSNSPLAEGLTETFFEDIAVPAGVYVYRIVAYNKDIEGKPQESKPSDTVTGFRSITLDEFVHLAYYETVRAEQRMAQALGKPRVADYDSGANANVTLPGNISGTVNYDLSVKGFSGTGTWTFADYSNFGFIVTGKTAMDSGMSKNGDVRGKLTFSGSYPGYLDYFVHVSKGNPSAGSNSYFKVQLYSPEWMIENYGSAEMVVYFSEDLIQSPY